VFDQAVHGQGEHRIYNGAALPVAMEDSMDEDRLNMDIRKFLKVVGVTSQREIEIAVRNAAGQGTLAANTVLKPRMTLEIPEIGLTHVIDGEISVG
jgi:hypothetical protein